MGLLIDGATGQLRSKLSLKLLEKIPQSAAQSLC